MPHPTITRRRLKGLSARSGSLALPSTKPSGRSVAMTRSRIPIFCFIRGLGSNLVVEVKGKRAKNKRGRRDWENWVTTDDLDGLVRWQAMFGPGFRAVLAFAYAEPIQPFPLPGTMAPMNFEASSTGSGRSGSTTISPTSGRAGPAWKAVAMARRAFRRRVRPLLEWLPMSYDWSRRPIPVKERQR